MPYEILGVAMSKTFIFEKKIRENLYLWRNFLKLSKRFRVEPKVVSSSKKLGFETKLLHKRENFIRIENFLVNLFASRNLDVETKFLNLSKHFKFWN